MYREKEETSWFHDARNINKFQQATVVVCCHKRSHFFDNKKLAGFPLRISRYVAHRGETTWRSRRLILMVLIWPERLSNRTLSFQTAKLSLCLHQYKSILKSFVHTFLFLLRLAHCFLKRGVKESGGVTVVFCCCCTLNCIKPCNTIFDEKLASFIYCYDTSSPLVVVFSYLYITLFSDNH